MSFRKTVSLVAIGLAALTSGCATIQLPRLNIYDVKKDPNDPPTFAGIPLKSGQVILTESPEATSFGFMLMPDQFYYFTHGGVVVMEEGEAWVYEIAAEIVTFPFHERVLDNVDGKVARRRLFEYVMPNLYAEVMDLEPGVDGGKVADFVRDHYKRKTKFDAFFRWNEHDTLFCTEFVELSQRAGAGSAVASSWCQLLLPRMRVTVVPHSGHLPLAMRRPLVSCTSPFSGRLVLHLTQ